MSKTDVFLKLDGIDGEAEDSKHGKEIEVESWWFEARQSGTGAQGLGLGGGKVELQDLHISKTMDKSSPKLFQYCATGKPVAKATLVARKAGGSQQEYLKINLTDVLITYYRPHMDATQSGVLPRDEFSLQFGKIEFEYSEQKNDGTLGGAVKGVWNVKAATAS